MKRKICIITGSRAEYGLLEPLLRELKKDQQVKLQLIATGMHLSAKFGLTNQLIEQDGFSVDEEVDILLNSDTATGIAKSMGRALGGFSEAYERLKPDLIVVLGDRFEIFSAVAAACVSKIPVAHISGGEVTRGAFDEAFRHCITKMSHLHFTSTEEYRKRVIQLGEDPKRVFNVGSWSIDNIRRLKLLSKRALEKKLNLNFNKRNLLVTFHPVTLEKNSKKQFQNLLNVLSKLRDTNIIFTKANADPEGRVINRMIEDYVSQNYPKAVAFTSMGQLNYLSTMRLVDAVVGNSSSGITEAPAFKIGTINVGDRQKGRIKGESIIDCQPKGESIKGAIKKLYSKDFQKRLKDTVNSYGDGKSAKRIKGILKNYNIKNILKKKFYDLRRDCR